MPVQRCKRNNKNGYCWGNTGFCYIGAGAKSKAEAQGRAIEASKKRKR